MSKGIRPQAKNANRHTQRGMAALEQSIASDGWIGAITVAADGETFDGSARVEKTAENGMLEDAIVIDSDGTRPIVVRRTDIPTAQDERAIRLGINANRVASLNLEWEPDVLAGIAEMGIDLASLNFTLDEWADVSMPTLPEPGGGGDEFDPTPEDGPTRTKLGDLWAIGPHRLLVGDCTDPANVARLMGGERAALCFTSPPYNSKSELHGTDKFRGSFYLDKDVDAMTAEDYRAFSQDVFSGIGLCVADDGNVCYNISYNKNNRDGYIFVIADAIAAGFNLYETITWIKTGMPNPASTDVLTRDFEFIFLLSRAQTYRTNKVKGQVRSNVWEINNAGAQQDNHKACFPMALPERAIQELTEENDIVADVFLGSGTTLIAAHRTGRRCYGMEISPRYADVILRRAEAESLECKLLLD